MCKRPSPSTRTDTLTMAGSWEPFVGAGAGGASLKPEKHGCFAHRDSSDGGPSFEDRGPNRASNGGADVALRPLIGCSCPVRRPSANLQKAWAMMVVRCDDIPGLGSPRGTADPDAILHFARKWVTERSGPAARQRVGELSIRHLLRRVAKGAVSTDLRRRSTDEPNGGAAERPSYTHSLHLQVAELGGHSSRYRQVP